VLRFFLRTWFICFGLSLLGILVLGFSITSYFLAYGQQEYDLAETIVDIPHGSSLRTVARLLAQQKIIPDQAKFYWYLRLGRNDGNHMQAGFYRFGGRFSKAAIADSLRYGRDQAFKVVFKEGENLADLGHSLEALGLVKPEDFLAAQTSSQLRSLIGYHPEGYLFPDSYFFTRKDSALSIMSTMYKRLLDKVDDVMHERMHELGKNLHEVLTLAAIIEKETGAPFERPIIASVYLNRLKIGMRLQADPTVIYGINNYDGKIRKIDLQTYHPYNTYKISGLPPGPIASPGLASIKAVLWPAQTNYLYFVSKNDGSHVFCPNLVCHNQAVKNWQIDFFKREARP